MQHKQSIDASVVIPTYNRERFLSVCLDCLIAQDYPSDKYEIIVVDDASTDGTRQMVLSKHSPVALRYIQQRQNGGTGIAKNAGIAAANGRIIIFSDSDAFAPPQYVKEHIRCHERNDHVMVDGPAINVSPERHLSEPPFSSLGVRILAFLGFCGQEFVNVNASCTREDLLRVGGFDKAFTGWEDLELAQRLRQSGVGRIRSRSAYVLHCQAGRKTPSEAAARMEFNGKYAAMFYQRYPSRRARRMARLRYLTYDRMFDNLGWIERYLTSENLQRLQESNGSESAFVKRVYMIHSYAEGMKNGFREQDMEIRRAA